MATSPYLPERHDDLLSSPKRWEGIVRDYSPEEVRRLRGSVQVRHTLAEIGAARLWQLLH